MAIMKLPFAGLVALMMLSSLTTTAQEIQWMTWDQAIAKNNESPRKIMIDVYTDWCGWCKRMDKSTFVDTAVVNYVNKHFYAVKFNAEQKEEISFSGHQFKFMASETGRGGTHELAYALLDGKMGYPTIVYLNEKYERIMISPGYKETPGLMKELRYAREEKYKDTPWEKYRDGNGE